MKLALLLLPSLAAAQLSMTAPDTLYLDRWHAGAYDVRSKVAVMIANHYTEPVRVDSVTLSDTTDCEWWGIMGILDTSAVRMLVLAARAYRNYDTTCRVTVFTDHYYGGQKFDVVCKAGLHGDLLEVGEKRYAPILQTGEYAFDIFGRAADTTHSGVYFIGRRKKVVVR